MHIPDTPPERLDLAVLDQAERGRVFSFTTVPDQRRYATAHILLRKVLGAATGIPPAELEFVREPCGSCGSCGGGHGRPRLRADRGVPEFSLSHSGEFVLVALAAAPVGVDVEEVPRLAAAHRLAAALHPDEQSEIAALPTAHQPSAVARIWTRKEAYLKGIGTGLSRDPALDYVGLGPQLRSPGLPGWSFARVPIAVGYAAAVAAHGSPMPRTLAPRAADQQSVLRTGRP